MTGLLLAVGLFSFAYLADTCSPERARRSGIPDGSVVVLGTAYAPDAAEATSLREFNVSDYNSLVLAVQVDKVVRGKFPVRPGSKFLLGHHTAARSFGDYDGAPFYLAFEPKGTADFELVGLSRPPGTLFAVRASIQGESPTPAPGTRRVDLSAAPDAFVAVTVLPGGVLPPELPAGAKLSLGLTLGRAKNPLADTSCLLVARKGGKAPGLRLVGASATR